MPGRDTRKIALALGKAGGKRLPNQRQAPFCGDIGLKIGRDGTWYYQESPIGRKALVKLFASVLRREDDGCHYLVTPAEKVVVTVEDAPLLAVEMTAEGEGTAQRLSFRTNLDDIVLAGPDRPLRFRAEPDGSFTPYLLVRDGLEARLVRSVYYDLVAAAVLSGGKQTLGVWSDGRFFPFPENSGVGGA